MPPCSSVSDDTAEYAAIAEEYLTGRCIIKRLDRVSGPAAGSTRGGVRRSFEPLAGHVGDTVYPAGVPCRIVAAAASTEGKEGAKAAEVSTHEVYLPLAAPVRRGDRIEPRGASFAGHLSVIGVNEEDTGRLTARARCVLLDSEVSA